MNTYAATMGGKTADPVIPSAAELLRIAFQGSDEELSELHLRCEDRRMAEAFAQALATVSPEQRERAGHWLESIRDMHPDLR